jgi:hypothetical protein
MFYVGGVCCSIRVLLRRHCYDETGICKDETGRSESAAIVHISCVYVFVCGYAYVFPQAKEHMIVMHPLPRYVRELRLISKGRTA